MKLLNKDKIRANNNEIALFIEDNDLYNSELIYKLQKLPRYNKSVPLGSTRLDMIANDIKGDIRFETNLILANNITQKETIEFKQREEISILNLNDLIE